MVDADIDRLCATIRFRCSPPDMVGTMNYAISRIVSIKLRRGVRYWSINEAMGVLACVQQELFRRLAGPYEDQKRKENGDVFDENKS